MYSRVKMRMHGSRGLTGGPRVPFSSKGTQGTHVQREQFAEMGSGSESKWQTRAMDMDVRVRDALRHAKDFPVANVSMTSLAVTTPHMHLHNAKQKEPCLQHSKRYSNQRVIPRPSLKLVRRTMRRSCLPLAAPWHDTWTAMHPSRTKI